MTKNDLRIIFMGTPAFAVESLKALVEGGYNVVAVITMPDKPAGRGQKIQYSPVKEYALSQNLPLLQPDKLKNETFIRELQTFQADLQIVVAFRMLPEVVWGMPGFGTFNLHASLLPQYRGAAPINWAIINGEQETGVSTFFLTHEIDTGKIILQKKIPIRNTDNAQHIHDKLMLLGAGLVCQTVDLLIEGRINTLSQEELVKDVAELKLAPKIFKETCELKNDLSVEQAYNFVRGLSPHPTAWVDIQFPCDNPTVNEPIAYKLYETFPEKIEHYYSIGKLITDGKKGAKIALKDGFLHLLEIQAPGKKRMKISDYLNGLK